MTPEEARFEARVDRSGEHHVWLGATDPARGTGRVKVGGRQVTAHRLAWELAHGPLPAGSRVRTCPEMPACVRLEHLSVDAGNARPPSRPAPRGRKGDGSLRRAGPGRWELAVSAGRYDDGTPRRLYRRVGRGHQGRGAAGSRSLQDRGPRGSASRHAGAT